jgi:hypothetical protein
MPYRHVAVLMLQFKSPVVTIKFNKILVPEQLILLEVTHQILPLIQNGSDDDQHFGKY